MPTQPERIHHIRRPTHRNTVWMASVFFRIHNAPNLIVDAASCCVHAQHEGASLLCGLSLRKGVFFRWISAMRGYVYFMRITPPSFVWFCGCVRSERNNGI